MSKGKRECVIMYLAMMSCIIMRFFSSQEDEAILHYISGYKSCVSLEQIQTLQTSMTWKVFTALASLAGLPERADEPPCESKVPCDPTALGNTPNACMSFSSGFSFGWTLILRSGSTLCILYYNLLFFHFLKMRILDI